MLPAIRESYVKGRLSHSYVVWLDGVACGATEESAFARNRLIQHSGWCVVDPDRAFTKELPSGHARIADVLL